MTGRLIFVYNAEAGLFAGLIDSVHKLVSPSTYPCSLCAVTYGALTMHPRWRAYLRALPYPVAFYHRADFGAAFPAAAGQPLPLIALDRGSHFEVLLPASELARLRDLDALMTALDAALSPPPPARPAHSARA